MRGRILPDLRSRHHSKALFCVVAAAVLAVGLIAFTVGPDSGSQAAGPERPNKIYAPLVARGEGSPAPTPGADGEINLQPQLDTANAVTKLVTYAAGATLTTTGADGSRYTLTLPPKSVLFDMTVTMTPITALGGLAASGGLRAGVQLEPDGMWLGVPATLDIVAASPVPASQEISFSYGGDGQRAYAYPLGVNASRTRFTILHFSGWTLASGTAAERTAFFQSKVDSVASQLNQKVAPITAAERERQEQSGTSDDTGSAEYIEELHGALETAYETLVKPAMDTAEALADSGDIDAVEPGLQAAASWEKQMTVTGHEGMQAERAALDLQRARILDKVRKNMRDRCFRLHQVEWGSRLFSLSRQQWLVGDDGGQAFEDAKGCLTFKLDFETIIAVRVSDQPLLSWKANVRVRGVPLNLGGFGALPVTQPLELLSFTGDTPPYCSSYSADVEPTEPFLVNSAQLVEGMDDNGRREAIDVALTIETGAIAGSYTYHLCGGGEPPPDITLPFAAPTLNAIFVAFHPGEGSPGGVTITGWQMLRGAVYAVKLYSRSTALGREDTILELRHTPE